VVAKGNYVHEYYLLPALIPVSLIMGKLLANIFPTISRRPHARQIAVSALLIGATVSGLVTYVSYIGQEMGTSTRLNLARQVEVSTAPGDLVIAIDNNDPTLLYLSHRKGWAASINEVLDSPSSRYRGARAILGMNYDHTFFQMLAADDGSTPVPTPWKP
jgi:hypothetical protein